VPSDVWSSLRLEVGSTQIREAAQRYGIRHLPQGAPTSPALANICFYRVDCRLSGLARTAGAVYTRYADDLAFSGDADFARVADRFTLHVGAILLEEGFRAHYRKTRVMRRSARQYLTGIVTNERTNVPRPDFDRLRAILHNCVRFGPATQNREGHADFRAHLGGRLSYIESIHPQKAARLRTLFKQIQW
jgi:RNA-directed DNA polymerase